jgi:glycosyltransferase involved in cell wall biosynthesis
MAPALRQHLRLVLVGDGPLRAEAQAILEQSRVSALAWMPGERVDIPNVLRGLDAFALPSLAEGISNTILEAMASALPVLAFRVGGNAELVADGQTGALVPSGDVEALARELVALATDPSRAAAMGNAGRRRVEQHFSLAAMVKAYQSVYDDALAGARSGAKNQSRARPVSKGR